MAFMKESTGDKLFRFFMGVVVFFIVCIMLYPFIWVISVSISDPSAVMRGKVNFLPVGPITLASYGVMTSYGNFLRAYANTILYAAVGTIITLLVTAITAYPLSLQRFRSKKFIVIFFIITMFFSGGMIPTFLVISELKMIDTIWAMVLPTALTAWNLMIFRAFYAGIPSSLNESAYVDGANDWYVLFKIIIPLSKPVIATIALFTIVGHWNAFFAPLLYLNSPEKYPLQMLLRNILAGAEMLKYENDGSMSEMLNNSSTQSLKMASIIITSLPVICVYPFVQKYFVTGIMIGSVKG
jgi:putative aldouronate transport system permease protein